MDFKITAGCTELISYIYSNISFDNKKLIWTCEGTLLDFKERMHSKLSLNQFFQCFIFLELDGYIVITEFDSKDPYLHFNCIVRPKLIREFEENAH